MRKIFLGLILVSLALAGYPSVDWGAGFHAGDRGSGIQVFRASFPSEKFGWYAEARFFDVRGKDEMITYDYYTNNYYTTGGISLAMLHTDIGFLYFPFAGMIANNFSPFLALQVGPNLVLDAAEEGNFWKRWGSIDTQVVPSVFIGPGIRFLTAGETSWTAAVGYDLLKLQKFADEDNNFSGLLIKLSLGVRKK